MAPPVKKNKKLFSANHRPISATGANQQKPLGSYVTAFGKRQSVRVAMKMNKRILRKINRFNIFNNFSWICSDLWMDTLPFFGRPQLGLKMALLSPRFNALVDKHFDSKRELPIWRPIRIDKMRKNTKLSMVTICNGTSKQFPLPKYPLPNKIRFANLQIAYIDHSVSTFLRANQQIFDKSGINLDLFVSSAGDDQPLWNAFARGIWPIFASNIRHLSFPSYYLDLRRHTSPSILSNLNIISIHSNDLLPAAIAYDRPKAKAGQALSKWLHTPTKDGKPKQLSCSDYGHTSETKRLIKSFKEAFLRATTSSASYIIRLEFFEPTEIEPFELTNERTNEMLTLAKVKKDDDFDCVLKRYQIGETDQWEDENPLDNLDKVNIMLYGNCIGQLSPPKAGKKSSEKSAGPSGEQKKKKK